MKTYFVCSDIHSYFDEWMTALASKGFDLNNQEHCIIVCGDLFDRGPQSIKCYTFAKEMTELNRFIYIRGNHEDLLFDAMHCIDKHLHVNGVHITNGTIDTIAQFLDTTVYDVLSYTFSWKDFDKLRNETLCKFITETAVDYFQLGNTFFVHGWLPTLPDETEGTVVDPSLADANWEQARWENGMELFKFSIVPEHTTVVCGHWHASYGHCVITNECSSEWGPTAKFSTFKYTNERLQSTIVALDACTAYTHFVNCEIFNEEGELIDA